MLGQVWLSNIPHEVAPNGNIKHAFNETALLVCNDIQADALLIASSTYSLWAEPSVLASNLVMRTPTSCETNSVPQFE